MIDKLLDVLHDVLHPDKNWGEFTRKIITFAVISLTTFVGLDLYWNLQERTDRFIPVSEMVKTKPRMAAKVKELLANFHVAYPQIKGIWLYSWPDAQNLDLVHSVGQGANPIPAGAFHPDEAEDVGKLSIDICTVLDRRDRNTACSIFGAGDAWGILVVTWHEEATLPKGAMSLIDALANRITHLLYYSND